MYIINTACYLRNVFYQENIISNETEEKLIKIQFVLQIYEIKCNIKQQTFNMYTNNVFPGS